MKSLSPLRCPRLRAAMGAALLLSISLAGQVQSAPSDPAKKGAPKAAAPTASPSEPAPASPASTPAPSLSPAETKKADETKTPSVDDLSDAELDQILTILKQRYISPSALNDRELKRSTVQGLLQRLGAGAAVLSATQAKPPEIAPFRSEIIDNRIGYVRLGSVDAANLAELDKALEGFAGKHLSSCVLDLRATPPGANFEQAAEVCRRFCPKGKVLFTVHRADSKQDELFTSKEEPKFHGLLAVLVSGESSGTAEIVAGVTRDLAKAVVIGHKTKGGAAEFADEPLASGKTLRFAVAEVHLPGEATLGAVGLSPDLSLDVSAETTAAVLRAEAEKGVAPLVAETERPRMNEAALVAGSNPELDALQSAQRNHDKSKPPLHDAALQRAIDLITSVAIFEKGSVRKK